MFLDERTGQVHKEGDVYRHPVLAATLRRIAEHGAEEFYSGETAVNLVRDLEEAGGVMTLSDLANYSVRWESPVRSVLPHTNLTLLTSPPPGSGSVLAAILGLSGLNKPRPADLNRPEAWQTFIDNRIAFSLRKADPAFHGILTAHGSLRGLFVRFHDNGALVFPLYVK